MRTLNYDRRRSQNADEEKARAAAQLEEVFRRAKLGLRLEALIKQPGWRDLTDQQAKDQARFTDETLWTPSRAGATVDSVALLSAYAGGRQYQLERMVQWIEVKIKDGEAARLELKKRGIEI